MNLRPLGPHPSALASLRHAPSFDFDPPVGFRSIRRRRIIANQPLEGEATPSVEIGKYRTPCRLIQRPPASRFRLNPTPDLELRFATAGASLRDSGACRWPAVRQLLRRSFVTRKTKTGGGFELKPPPDRSSPDFRLREAGLSTSLLLADPTTSSPCSLRSCGRGSSCRHVP